MVNTSKSLLMRIAGICPADRAVELLELLVAAGDDAAVRALWRLHGKVLGPARQVEDLVVADGRAWLVRLWLGSTDDPDGIARLVASDERRVTVLAEAAANPHITSEALDAICRRRLLRAAAVALRTGRVSRPVAVRTARWVAAELRMVGDDGRVAAPSEAGWLSRDLGAAVCASLARDWDHRLGVEPHLRAGTDPWLDLVAEGTADQVVADLVDRAVAKARQSLPDLMALAVPHPALFDQARTALARKAAAGQVDWSRTAAAFRTVAACPTATATDLAWAAKDPADMVFVAGRTPRDGLEAADVVRTLKARMTAGPSDTVAWNLSAKDASRLAASYLAALADDPKHVESRRLAATHVGRAGDLAGDVWAWLPDTARAAVRADLVRAGFNPTSDVTGTPTDLVSVPSAERAGVVGWLLAHVDGDADRLASLSRLAGTGRFATLGDLVAVHDQVAGPAR